MRDDKDHTSLKSLTPSYLDPEHSSFSSFDPKKLSPSVDPKISFVDPARRERYDFMVSDEASGKRLDLFIFEAAKAQGLSWSRSQIQKWIEDGRIEIVFSATQLKPSYPVVSGETVRVAPPPPKRLQLEAENVPLDIVYEDEDIAVINKPAGLTVHPAPGHEEGTLVHALLFHLKNLSGIGGAMRPGIVHRLDKDTSGLLLVAKNDAAHQKLTAQFHTQQVERRYIALVCGEMKDDEGEVRLPIARHPVDRKRMAVSRSRGKAAHTRYRVLERFSGYTMIEAALITGRTHQIRVHMTAIGHPLIGDPVYGSCRRPEIKRQALHAALVSFTHPRTGKTMRFTSPLPEDLTILLAALRKHRDA